MSRKRINQNEVRIPRTITVSPSFWIRFKSWCRGKSMSEMLEIAALRLMDEKNDVLSLQQQIEELRTEISTKTFDYKKLQVELENDQHSLALLQDRISEVRSNDQALKAQRQEDYEFMHMVVTDKISIIKRSFPNWMDEGNDIASYLPSIETVQKRSTILDKYNPVKTRMAWIALKFPEEDWERRLKDRA
tara:strand:- start:4666 stop:5235 length:570 start_codon:yes stop_codon:yes gene_type:complete